MRLQAAQNEAKKEESATNSASPDGPDKEKTEKEKTEKAEKAKPASREYFEYVHSHLFQWTKANKSQMYAPTAIESSIPRRHRRQITQTLFPNTSPPCHYVRPAHTL
jgi:hypothetical protein